MSAIASPRARRLIFPAWCVWSALAVGLMWLDPGLERVPFHLVWVSLAIVYGLQAWPLRWAVTACVVIAVVTGIPLASHAHDGVLAYEEVAEMSALFLVMVWQVRRRITAAEKARRSAEREKIAKRMQQSFVRLASHELRTPITVARGYAELLREDCTQPHLVEDATVVLDELGKLERISGRLLALAASHDAQRTQTVQAGALVRRVAKRWAPVAGRPVRAEAAAALVVGDDERLETALDCLVENAITHTDCSSIVLRAFRQGSWAVLEVEDDGPGMASQPPALERPGSGNAQHGLGLAIVRGVVDAHGGELAFGQGGDGGLRVTIRLPLASRPLGVAARP